MSGEKVLELVVFQLAEGVQDEDFLQTVGPVSEWVRTQPGFISRDLVHGVETDKWIEVVLWESLEQAKAAAEAAMTSETCSPMFSKIDFESIEMLHGLQAIAEVTSDRVAA